ncbi:procollagen-lysine,2-oxoglutarate 5-dioxygenase-like [Symsagittifera roscoffensis]|uniref:procollagen-lysine,2-oxoglutarate 5-dioxygenase-like n=1 Tax=Symsagittifera roscoffensis TaxID=84072 RepID=UPI00307BDB9E
MMHNLLLNGRTFKCFIACLILLAYAERVSGVLYHYTVATQPTDGMYQLLESAENNNITVNVLGLNSDFDFVDMESAEGGAFKLKVLHQELVKLKHKLTTADEHAKCSSMDNKGCEMKTGNTNNAGFEGDETKENDEMENKQKINLEDVKIIFTDAYDVIYVGGGMSEKIEAAFDGHQVDVLFGAEVFCWPDDELSVEYPEVESPYKYLNSGGFIGKLSAILELLSGVEDLKNHDDDQRFFTHKYLSNLIEKKYSIGLDTSAKIFQNLNGAYEHVNLFVEDGTTEYGKKVVLWNEMTDTKPMVLHGNGASKNFLNFYLANYILPKEEIPRSDELLWDLAIDNDGKLPTILVSLIFDSQYPFLEEFFANFAKLEYPRKKLIVQVDILRPALPQSQKITRLSAQYLRGMKHTIFFCAEDDEECDVRATIFSILHEIHTDQKHSNPEKPHLLLLDPSIHITNSKMLLILIKTELKIMAPIVSHDGSLWSNFWGAVNEDGYYSRALDYVNVVNRQFIGVFNVPYITGIVMIKADAIANVLNTLMSCASLANIRDMDIFFAACLRKRGVFMSAFNEETYGYLVTNNDYIAVDEEEESKTGYERELFAFFDAMTPWKNRYVDMDAYNELTSKKFISQMDQPCPEVFRLKLFNEKFTRSLINLAEHVNEWSGGGHSKAPDKRHGEGFVESYPTVDVHLYQLGFNTTWLHLIKYLMEPVFNVLYPDFNFAFDNPRADYGDPGFMFVARYRPEDQSFLRPHHDASTYTLNMALNIRGKDYEGGGCRFIRQNCSVTDSKPGEVLIHPGKLTHLHEGLNTTKGTRYILVSFMQPR